MKRQTRKSKRWGWVENFRGGWVDLDQVDNLCEHQSWRVGDQPPRYQWQRYKLPSVAGAAEERTVATQEWAMVRDPLRYRLINTLHTHFHIIHSSSSLFIACSNPGRDSPKSPNTHNHCFWAELINFSLLWICIAYKTSWTWNLKCRSKINLWSVSNISSPAQF